MLQKIAGGGHFLQNSQFIIIYKDIILGINLIGPNLSSRNRILLYLLPNIGIPNFKPFFD